MLKGQDILVLLKLAGRPPSWTYASVAHELDLSQSAVHRSLERAEQVGLWDSRRRQVDPGALLEFLSHALKYLFPPIWRGEARGRPTAWAAPPLAAQLVSSGRNQPVWPDPIGRVRGVALEPLHPSVLDAVRKDKVLWELLALADAIRICTPRERNLAIKELRKRLAPGRR